MNYDANLRSVSALPAPPGARETYSKVTWRILPLLLLCYFSAYFDRVNVGFAKLQMLGDLRFSETAYGFGAGVFFVGYALFQMPSNIILYRLGARLWIGCILVVWGFISAGMVLVHTEPTFYALRFLLGVAEAGFFPGVILYLTYWYPSVRRGRMTTIFMAGIPVSGIIGGPLSGWILQNLAGVHGLAGWQWMFLLEGLPSIVLGVIVILFLRDGIQDAPWLSGDEKALLQAELDADAPPAATASLGSMFANALVWLAAAVYLTLVMGLYGISFWLPTLIREAGIRSPLDIGLLSVIPYAVTIVGMVLFAYSADRRRERRWHVAIPLLLGAGGLVVSTLFGRDIPIALAALSVATLGIIAAQPLFWSLPTAFLGGVAAAAGIALINAVGNIAGFISPYLVGWLTDLTSSTDSGMFVLAGVLVVGAALTLCFPRELVNK
ncbi:MFS transporter [Burkholderia sp. WAC0059]|uniref:MFS transporter n=1 Tax=Burkholderia sp. WAC0059 TaxID=2066022 RepID=UPI000C7F6494|nr:MFS transporter [Burkholderia sp. WAC0059]PLZ01391.1 MFS transporter [Burkholderia sp. WAC0059]